MNGSREARRVTGQTSQIVAQFSIVSLDRVGLALVGHWEIESFAVSDCGVGSQLVAVIPIGWRRLVHQFLDKAIADVASDPTPDQTMRGTVNEGHDECFVFLR